MIRVLVVHKIRLTCDLTAAALHSEPDIKVVDFAHSAEDALAKLDKHQIDVAVVNINLPDNGALRFTRAVTRSGKGVKVLIDAKAIMFLLGTEMDFQTNALKSGFVFNNPNIGNRCACGKSFTP